MKIFTFAATAIMLLTPFRSAIAYKQHLPHEVETEHAHAPTETDNKPVDRLSDIAIIRVLALYPEDLVTTDKNGLRTSKYVHQRIKNRIDIANYINQKSGVLVHYKLVKAQPLPLKKFNPYSSLFFEKEDNPHKKQCITNQFGERYLANALLSDRRTRNNYQQCRTDFGPDLLEKLRSIQDDIVKAAQVENIDMISYFTYGFKDGGYADNDAYIKDDTRMINIISLGHDEYVHFKHQDKKTALHGKLELHFLTSIFAHEAGHNFGAQHDLHTIKTNFEKSAQSKIEQETNKARQESTIKESEDLSEEAKQEIRTHSLSRFNSFVDAVKDRDVYNLGFQSDSKDKFKCYSVLSYPNKQSYLPSFRYSSEHFKCNDQMMGDKYSDVVNWINMTVEDHPNKKSVMPSPTRESRQKLYAMMAIESFSYLITQEETRKALLNLEPQLQELLVYNMMHHVPEELLISQNSQLDVLHTLITKIMPRLNPTVFIPKKLRREHVEYFMSKPKHRQSIHALQRYAYYWAQRIVGISLHGLRVADVTDPNKHYYFQKRNNQHTSNTVMQPKPETESLFSSIQFRSMLNGHELTHRVEENKIIINLYMDPQAQADILRFKIPSAYKIEHYNYFGHPKQYRKKLQSILEKNGLVLIRIPNKKTGKITFNLHTKSTSHPIIPMEVIVRHKEQKEPVHAEETPISSQATTTHAEHTVLESNDTLEHTHVNTEKTEESMPQDNSKLATFTDIPDNVHIIENKDEIQMVIDTTDDQSTQKRKFIELTMRDLDDVYEVKNLIHFNMKRKHLSNLAQHLKDHKKLKIGIPHHKTGIITFNLVSKSTKKEKHITIYVEHDIDFR